MEKDENATEVPAKPSDPSDPSANLDEDENKDIDKKEEGEIVKDMIKSEPMIASPPSEFQCYYCKQFQTTGHGIIGDDGERYRGLCVCVL
jgi:hypothetical protein